MPFASTKVWRQKSEVGLDGTNSVHQWNTVMNSFFKKKAVPFKSKSRICPFEPLISRWNFSPWRTAQILFLWFPYGKFPASINRGNPRLLVEIKATSEWPSGAFPCCKVPLGQIIKMNKGPFYKGLQIANKQTPWFEWEKVCFYGESGYSSMAEPCMPYR